MGELATRGIPVVPTLELGHVVTPDGTRVRAALQPRMHAPTLPREEVLAHRRQFDQLLEERGLGVMGDRGFLYTEDGVPLLHDVNIAFERKPRQFLPGSGIAREDWLDSL